MRIDFSLKQTQKTIKIWLKIWQKYFLIIIKLIMSQISLQSVHRVAIICISRIMYLYVILVDIRQKRMKIRA